jgi:beta-lactamase regulating signal transducer with metallopeptidase domain
MPQFFLYLIKVNIALISCYCMYYFLLRKLTFYTLNRWFLLSSIVIASIFPLINFARFFEQQQNNGVQSILHYTPNWENVHVVIAQSNTSISIWGVLYFTYWVGVAIMFIYFLVQSISLLRIHLSSSKKIDTENLRITNKNIQPFSFFKTIYLNPEKHDWQEIQTIIQHERIHTRELHTIDVIIAEVNKIMYWFNLGVWLLKNAIRENLEFIADEKVLAAGKNIKEYQYELLQVITGINYRSGLANQFSLFHLKNRIKMMNKNKSSKWSKAKYALLIPMLCAMAIVVAQKKNKAKDVQATAQIQSNNNIIEQNELDAFVKRHSTIKTANWGYLNAVEIEGGEAIDSNAFVVGPIMHITFKNDKFEMYQYNKEADRKKFKQNYGEEMPKISTDLEKEMTHTNEKPNYGIPKEYLNDEYQIEVKLINGVMYAIAYNNDWKEVSRIKLSSGEKELDKWQKQYGAIPPPPPPPPPPPLPFEKNPPPPPPPPPPVKGVDKINGVVAEATIVKKVEIRSSKENTNPLIIVDGEVKDKQFLDAMQAADIESVNVLKDKNAIAQYGDKGKAGIINVTTKKYKTSINGNTDKSATVTLNAKENNNTGITVKKKSSNILFEDGKPTPLIVLDGKTVEKIDIEALNPDDIKAIEVLKGETAILKYAEKGKDGVIIISTKKGTITISKKSAEVL